MSNGCSVCSLSVNDSFAAGQFYVQDCGHVLCEDCHSSRDNGRSCYRCRRLPFPPMFPTDQETSKSVMDKFMNVAYNEIACHSGDRSDQLSYEPYPLYFTVCCYQEYQCYRPRNYVWDMFLELSTHLKENVRCYKGKAVIPMQLGYSLESIPPNSRCICVYQDQIKLLGLQVLLSTPSKLLTTAISSRQIYEKMVVGVTDMMCSGMLEILQNFKAVNPQKYDFALIGRKKEDVEILLDMALA